MTVGTGKVLKRSVKANSTLHDFQVKYRLGRRLAVTDGKICPKASFLYGKKLMPLSA